MEVIEVFKLWSCHGRVKGRVGRFLVESEELGRRCQDKRYSSSKSR